MIEQIVKYLPRSPMQLFMPCINEPLFLHADMTDENLLGQLQNGIWEPIGLLDFGDSRVGDLIYELIPIHIDIFKCDKNLTMELMKSYGLEIWQKNAKFFVQSHVLYITTRTTRFCRCLEI